MVRRPPSQMQMMLLALGLLLLCALRPATAAMQHVPGHHGIGDHTLHYNATLHDNVLNIDDHAAVIQSVQWHPEQQLLTLQLLNSTAQPLLLSALTSGTMVHAGRQWGWIDANSTFNEPIYATVSAVLSSTSQQLVLSARPLVFFELFRHIDMALTPYTPTSAAQRELLSVISVDKYTNYDADTNSGIPFNIYNRSCDDITSCKSCNTTDVGCKLQCGVCGFGRSSSIDIDCNNCYQQYNILITATLTSGTDPSNNPTYNLVFGFFGGIDVTLGIGAVWDVDIDQPVTQVLLPKVALVGFNIGSIFGFQIPTMGVLLELDTHTDIHLHARGVINTTVEASVTLGALQSVMVTKSAHDGTLSVTSGGISDGDNAGSPGGGCGGATACEEQSAGVTLENLTVDFAADASLHVGLVTSISAVFGSFFTASMSAEVYGELNAHYQSPAFGALTQPWYDTAYNKPSTYFTPQICSESHYVHANLLVGYTISDVPVHAAIGGAKFDKTYALPDNSAEQQVTAGCSYPQGSDDAPSSSSVVVQALAAQLPLNADGSTNTAVLAYSFSEDAASALGIHPFRVRVDGLIATGGSSSKSLFKQLDGQLQSFNVSFTLLPPASAGTMSAVNALTLYNELAADLDSALYKQPLTAGIQYPGAKHTDSSKVSAAPMHRTGLAYMAAGLLLTVTTGLMAL